MKIGFLITVRLKSSRFPFKVLMDLDGKPVIERIIDRAKQVQGISEIVVCTSTNPQDKPLADIALKNNVYCFNGSEEDVLNRLLLAAKFYDLDYFVGITADNPLFSIYYSNLIVDKIKKNKYDFIKVNNLPLGCATYGMRVKALETICKVKTIVDTEIWGRLIDRPDIFDVYAIESKDLFNKPNLRLTLDYFEDYNLFNNLYKNIEFEKVLSLYDVLEYLDNNPNIIDINKNCIQLDLDPETIDEINKRYNENYEKIKLIKEKIYR